MALTGGTRIGPYEIVALIGAGGMGEVYRARDTRLGRDVAIKALPAAVARDPERLARFEREARLLAALNHPNIGAIYGLEESGEDRYLVLELVEGETLAARLERGALPLPEAYEICSQVAAGLESAHEQGIVHRDLKPGNVVLTPSGGVKVLDLGLAKASAVTLSGPDLALSASPTLMRDATGAGLILGTAAYMSPEQARGKAVDKRSDIWSFGALLYECLTGRQCFEGETVSDLIAQILQTEPDWSALPTAVPERARQLLARCLEKDARRRLRDIGEARIELEDLIARRSPAAAATTPAAGPTTPGATSPPTRRRTPTLVALALTVLAAVLATVAVQRLRQPRAAHDDVMRFEVIGSDGVRINPDGAQSALSPNGKLLAVVGFDGRVAQLYVRSLATLQLRPLAGTEGALTPFWSPDSRSIGFFTETKLKRVPAAGGAVDDVCNVKRARGGTWNASDVIVFARESEGPLYAISANGGEPRQVTTLDAARHEVGHRYPFFLPDGKHFLFAVLPPVDGRFEIQIGALDSASRESLLQASSGAAYDGAGHLLYLRGTTLVSHRFDAAQRRLSGEPVPLREPLSLTEFAGSPGFSVSPEGSLSYATSKIADVRLARFDREGRETSPVPIEPGPFNELSLSPDGRRVALTRTTRDESAIWLGDLDRGVVTRFSQETPWSFSPRWSPDGSRIAYLTSQRGPETLVVRPVSGTAPAEKSLAEDQAFKLLYGWTPDSKSVLYGRQDPATRWDLWRLPLDGDRRPTPYLVTPFGENGLSVSSDGRWGAYESDESGRTELVVQSFPVPGAKYQVTTAGVGGGWPPWGGELLFGDAAHPGVIRAASVLPGNEFRLGPSRNFGKLPADIISFNLTPDQQGLIALVPTGKAPPASFTVVLNWRAELPAER